MSALKNKKPVDVLIGLGSNIAPEKNIRAALDILAKKADLIRTSTIWQSPAVGSSGPDYLNSAALIRTTHNLQEIKSLLITPVESELGRVRSADKFMDRTIDLDILVFNGDTIDPELWTQAHIALPASELMPNLKHEKTGITLHQAAGFLRRQVSLIQRLDLKAD